MDGFKMEVRLREESALVCNGDGRVDGRDQAGVSVDYDVHG